MKVEILENKVKDFIKKGSFKNNEDLNVTVKNEKLNSNNHGIPDKEEIKTMVNDLNESVTSLANKIKFTFNDSNDMVIVTVRNADTDEVVREIPSKEIVRLHEHFKEFLGVIVDESI